MSYHSRLLSCLSSAILGLTLSQTALAVTLGEELAAAPGASQAPAATAESGTLVQPGQVPPEVAERYTELERLKAMATDRRWEQRRVEINQRYEDLRQRAAAANVILPDNPPWENKSTTAGPGTLPEPPPAPAGMPMPMSPETYGATRERHYQEMQARRQGLDQPQVAPQLDVPPAGAEERGWARTREVVKDMTPEQRDACMALHGLQGPMPGWPPMGGGWGMPGPGWGPAPGWGYGGRGYPEPDWGFGPEQGWDPQPGYGPYRGSRYPHRRP